MAHAPLCTASSGAAAAWTWSRAAAPRCPSSNMGTSWSSPMSMTLGLFWASQPTTTPSRRLAHHPPEA
ncbi:lysine-ketoglutarate reductase/saccharopine dehydrogenase bifunctional enzyme [Zea mays]|uniref:Lysine-ketoglutarate reductase/saccharopine dehydrogenase bifunctional enzyme n=1 Tax=Zea mays TaxID=4577 RepID=A0A1D6HMD8_MAIZE|nr:lysine-ketoglutarate reductase/saccharopine dehydrogenase bifunctional enzyme [Zea mays]AQK75523.1 lysine-ketoglutarate reductase/saccharopine dehydrogenase bifunctional enzyme [Zea mays]